MKHQAGRNTTSKADKSLSATVRCLDLSLTNKYCMHGVQGIQMTVHSESFLIICTTLSSVQTKTETTPWSSASRGTYHLCVPEECQQQVCPTQYRLFIYWLSPI